MALPSSGTLSLNDIRVELQQASTNVSLGAMSNLVGFVDPDAVSEFYGYSYAAYNTFSIYNDPYNESTEACLFGGADNLTLYFAGSGGTPACPTSGVYVFTDSALTTEFNGQGRYWKSNQCNAAFYIIKNIKDGFIEGVIGC